MRIRHYLMLAAVALILVGSFFLPNAVAGVTDLRRFDNLIMIDSQSIRFDIAPELSLPERIALAASPYTERLPVITGNSMDGETAGDRAGWELIRFFSGSPYRLENSGMTVAEGSAVIIIDAAVPAQNMIVWDFNVYDRAGNTATVTIDDETGMIVGLIFKLGDSGSFWGAETFRSPDNQFLDGALNLAEMMTEYYGIPVKLADYQFSGSLSYYRADIDNGNLVIPMYGVVRASSFTINERLRSLNN